MQYLTFNYNLVCNKGLKGNLFKLYLLLYKYSNKEGYCWVSNKRLSEDTGLGVDTIRVYLSRLEKMGLIENKKSLDSREITPLIKKSALQHTRLDTEILRDKTLCGEELRLYILICIYRDFGGCTKTNRIIQTTLSISERSLKKHLISLEKKGFIVRHGITLNRKIIPLKYLCDKAPQKDYRATSEEKADCGLTDYEFIPLLNKAYTEPDLDFPLPFE